MSFLWLAMMFGRIFLCVFFSMTLERVVGFYYLLDLSSGRPWSYPVLLPWQKQFRPGRGGVPGRERERGGRERERRGGGGLGEREREDEMRAFLSVVPLVLLSVCVLFSVEPTQTAAAAASSVSSD